MDNREKMKKICMVLKKRYDTEHFARNKFELLIGTILSQRTRDENTERACDNLFSVAKTPKAILKLPMKRLQKLIRPSGFYRQKAKNIKQVCKILVEKYNGRIPRTRGELLKLPGVGYKTADIILSYGYGIPTIAVDTHVNRVSKRIGFIDSKAGVEEVRKRLEELVSGKNRLVINLGLVQFGREICRPRNPKCGICPFNGFCEYYKKLFIGRSTERNTNS